MLHNNYTQLNAFFKDVTTKYFEEDNATGGYKAFIEMPIKEHVCPYCGNITTYIKDYRLQTVTDLPNQERAKVKKITMDLSSLFRSVAKTIFPEAKIIADKFHVIRVVVNSLENVRKRVQKEFHATKRKWFKRSCYLLYFNTLKYKYSL
mgnify:CR=1 FL=1